MAFLTLLTLLFGAWVYLSWERVAIYQILKVW
jgi:hypothetical protein